MNYVPEHFILLKLCFCIPLTRHTPPLPPLTNRTLNAEEEEDATATLLPQF